MALTNKDVVYLADTLADAIRAGFIDLGDRIAQGTNPENVAMSLKYIADNLESVAGSLAQVADGLGEIAATKGGG